MRILLCFKTVIRREERCLHKRARGRLRRATAEAGDSVKSILDRSFRYTSSVETDLRKTFARIRREQRAAQPPLAHADAETLAKVRPLRQRAV